MNEIPFKFALTVATGAISGGTAVLSEHTLIPLGIFTAVSVVLVGAAWKVSSAVTKATNRLERVEMQIDAVEQKIKELSE